MNNWPVLHRVDRLPATLRNMKADNKNKCGNGAAAASVCGQPPASAFRRNAEAPRRLSEGAEVGLLLLLLLLHCCTAALLHCCTPADQLLRNLRSCFVIFSRFMRNA